jgi:anti-sigma28 factor (negative regulator of flagellin synthesis)
VVGNMDLRARNDAFPECHAVTQRMALYAQDVQHGAEPTDGSAGSDHSWRLGATVVCRSIGGSGGSEVREAKVRSLQAAIHDGTYHVPAEQIADRILRSMLMHDQT